MTKLVEGTGYEADSMVWTFQQLATEFTSKLKRF